LGITKETRQCWEKGISGGHAVTTKGLGTILARERGRKKKMGSRVDHTEKEQSKRLKGGTAEFGRGPARLTLPPARRN